MHRTGLLHTAVLRALNGEYILPEAGGDLLRDGAAVLPTGRNIYALDPYRMPSTAAMARGAALAAAILEQHWYVFCTKKCAQVYNTHAQNAHCCWVMFLDCGCERCLCRVGLCNMIIY